MKHFFILLLFTFAQNAFGLHVSQSLDGVGYELFEDLGKQGLKNDQGEIIIPAKYDALGWSQGDFSIINNTVGYQEGENWGLINLENKLITSPEYSKLYPADPPLLVAAKPGRISKRNFFGVISSSGKVVLAFKYASVKIVEERAIVSVKSGSHYLYGVVDLSDRVIIPGKYERITSLGSLRFAAKDFEHNTTLFDHKGNLMLDFEIDSVGSFMAGYAVIFKNHAAGLINEEGIIVSPVQNKAYDLSGDHPNVLPFDHWFVLDDLNKTCMEFDFDRMRPFDSDLMKVYANGKTWLIDSTGNNRTPLNFTYLGTLQNERLVFRKNNKWGVINNHGKIIIDARFDSVFLNDDMIYARERINSSPKWSLYDVFGEKKSDQHYERIGNKTGYLYPVRKKGYWGFINRSGEEVIHCVYDEVSPVVDARIAVKFHNEYGVIDKEGEWVILPQKKPVRILSDQLFLEFSGKLTQLKSFDNDLIYFTENRLEVFNNYLLEHLNDGSVWKIDFSGRIVNKASHGDKYQEVRPPAEGFYAVKIDDRYGFIDNQNRLRIANRYDEVRNFSGGLAAFKLLGRWGFIDKWEKIRVQPLYDEVLDFKNGLAIVTTSGKMGLVNTKGERVSSFDYDSVYREENGRFVVVKDQKKGLINEEGRLIVNAKYDELHDIGNDFIIVKKFGKYGVVSLDGVDVIPLIYDELSYNPGDHHYLARKKSDWKEVDLRLFR